MVCVWADYRVESEESTSAIPEVDVLRAFLGKISLRGGRGGRRLPVSKTSG